MKFLCIHAVFRGFWVSAQKSPGGIKDFDCVLGFGFKPWRTQIKLYFCYC